MEEAKFYLCSTEIEIGYKILSCFILFEIITSISINYIFCVPKNGRRLRIARMYKQNKNVGRLHEEEKMAAMP